eukprot:TRINITY_DN29220_c0_g1_i1.p1 TRINITY_DN29220_c0_g1~~TRINITY_DN29220_c0_g1_i1.p1  ORF type:complete len:370 (-),score=69.09 TRINITY_DN29220_c0_g1_i1:285-1283(-)
MYVLGIGLAFLPISIMIVFFLYRSFMIGEYKFCGQDSCTADPACTVDNYGGTNANGAVCQVETSVVGNAFAFYIFAMNMWATITLQYVELAMIAGVVGTYYFHEKDESLTKGAVKASFKRATTTSLGSLIYGAFILTTIRIVRMIIDNARAQAAGDGSSPAAQILLSILSCIISFIEGLIEFLTRYTVINVALTGADFCNAGRQTFEMLKRNLVSTVVVDSITGFVLGVGSFVFSLMVAGIMYLIASAALEDPVIKGLFVFIAWLFAFMAITFFSDVVQQAMNAVFVCWTIDKDNNLNTRPEIHEAYDGFAVMSEEEARKKNPQWFRNNPAQ